VKNRSPIAVLLLPIFTFGIYQVVWYVKTKNEMNSLGATIPTAWLLIVPIVSIWWLWEFSGGVEKVTNNGMGRGVSFVMIFLLGGIGAAVAQNAFNKSSASVKQLQNA